ncbi:MAG: DNA-processing protein DprA [bacterium]
MINVKELLALSSVPRIGPHKIRALVAHFGGPAEVLQASPRELIQVQGIEKKLASSIAHHKTGNQFATQQLKRLNNTGGRIITIWEKEYPDLLKKIYDPPAFIFVLGKLKVEDRFAIAIVGTRAPSHYGRMIAEMFTKELSTLGVTIVSGLARGIDTIAHSNCVSTHCRTIAVIGSGIDIPYPPENQKLMERIAEHGAIISEFPMGAKPDATNFPRRNRIISGMTFGTIVIESAIDGGAMITASTALDQNREVFAVPGNINEKRSAGPNTLIREGRAKLVLSAEDVLSELELQFRPLLKKERVHEALPTITLTLFERAIFECLSAEPIHIDTLAEQAETSTSDALVQLLSLEFKGVVTQLPGKYFVRSPHL